MREGVAVWPGPRAPRIPGRLSLVKQAGVLFLAWLPYSRGCLQQDGSFRVVPAAAGGVAAGAGGARAVFTVPNKDSRQRREYQGGGLRRWRRANLAGSSSASKEVAPAYFFGHRNIERVSGSIANPTHS